MQQNTQCSGRNLHWANRQTPAEPSEISSVFPVHSVRQFDAFPPAMTFVFRRSRSNSTAGTNCRKGGHYFFYEYGRNGVSLFAKDNILCYSKKMIFTDIEFNKKTGVYETVADII